MLIIILDVFYINDYLNSFGKDKLFNKINNFKQYII